ncbi:uncharacterized protein B0H18DRAFT_1047122 [Fomitopsis serialis]|uniref:uncharacterized protein n=1 Tax=Fomitopsis serialis TaxID=139415 RepID=UPI0020074223|nr:uncharacterized protein B0H18DRAFT_1047122 [Neoantrodia serialis]KAH9913925.1 hypothetical protein B0H18DRAFT_1047122 [Neoantrodia serialis]
MSQRKLGTNYALPDNPEWITFPRSDGDPGALPKNTQRIVDSKGEVNYMRPVQLDEGQAINWRVNVGAQVANLLNYPKGPNYVLQNWPEGYQFYDHNKGPAKSPRHDPYLCGSTLVNRFRSTNEFIPHAVWLMSDETLNRGNCECKYCAKKPQRVVTTVLDLPSAGSRRGSSIMSSPTKSIRRHREVRKPKPYAQVRRAPKPVKPPRVGPEQSLVPERDNDVRHSLMTGHSSGPRWHRKGELVWCVLNPPIWGEKPDDCILFWPGVIERVDVHGDVLRDENAVDSASDSAPAQPPEPGPGPASDGGSSQVVAGDVNAKPPWDVRQWYSYNVKLLAVTHACAASDREVLPYLAYAPPEQLLGSLQDHLQQIMHSKAIAEMDSDLSHTFMFNPVSLAQSARGPSAAGPSAMPDPDPVRYSEAVAPFSLAVQIASNVAGFWGPTDEWECKFTVPLNQPLPPPPPAEPRLPTQESDAGLTLEALLNQAAENNAVDVTHRPTAQNIDVDGVYRPPGMSDAEFEEVRTRVLGPGGPTHVVTQTRYQGLWWGAERIWTDELVRLKLARCQFAPRGSGYAEVINEGSMGAGEKGLFMLLEGLFVVDVLREDGEGLTKECRASGQLYELADEDWEDPMEPQEPPPQANGNGKGKGKERATDTGEGASNGVVPPPGPWGPSFMPGPSPLRPPPLPNPDPTVSVADTAEAALAQTTQGSGKPKSRTVGSQLSHPANSVPYPLPKAPKGFKFRRIHPPGHEVVLSLPLISGRYYPGLLEHPLMGPIIDKAFAVPSHDGGLEKSRHIWAMEGLVAGVHQSMDPTIWKPSRSTMFKDADVESRGHFKALWEEVKEGRQMDLSQFINPDIMDVEMR